MISVNSLPVGAKIRMGALVCYKFKTDEKGSWVVALIQDKYTLRSDGTIEGTGTQYSEWAQNGAFSSVTGAKEFIYKAEITTEIVAFLKEECQRLKKDDFTADLTKCAKGDFCTTINSNVAISEELDKDGYYQLIAPILSFSMPSYKGFKGDVIKIPVNIKPDGMKPFITWSSSDPTIATVDQNGLVTFLKSGSVKINASTKY